MLFLRGGVGGTRDLAGFQQAVLPAVNLLAQILGSQGFCGAPVQQHQVLSST